MIVMRRAEGESEVALLVKQPSWIGYFNSGEDISTYLVTRADKELMDWEPNYSNNPIDKQREIREDMVRMNNNRKFTDSLKEAYGEFDTIVENYNMEIKEDTKVKV